MSGPVDQLIALLDQERRALVAGDGAVAGLARLAPRKAALLARIEAMGPDLRAADLDRLRHAATRSARVIEAALDGMRHARAQIEAARNPEARTYDRSGKRRDLARMPGALERRA